VTCQDLPKLLDEVFGISEAHQIAKAINAHDAKLAQTSAFGNRRKGRGACHPDGKRPTRRSEPERPAKLWEAWLHSLKVVGLAVFELPAHEIAPSRSGIKRNRGRYQVTTPSYRRVRTRRVIRNVVGGPFSEWPTIRPEPTLHHFRG
jgi:hypothetical protein